MKLSLAFAALAAAQTSLVQDYCGFLEQKCYSALQINASTCVLAMASIPDGFIGEGDNNTIGCRLNYLNGSTFDVKNCRYAAPSGGGRCGQLLDSVCTVATTLCWNVSGSPYNDSASCLTGLTPLAAQWGSLQGLASANDNSLECRVYHALASVGAPVHCQHFGFNSPTCTNPVAPDKQHYCDVLQYNCNSMTTLQYADPTQCLAVAQNYIDYVNSTSDAVGASGANSLGCREYHAQASKQNPAVHCEHAGPSGGNQCGTFAGSWGIMAAVAPCNDTSVNSLISQVGEPLVNMMVPIGNSMAYSKYLDTVNNSQVCRIYHLGVATGAPSHCVHGAIHGGATCGDYITNLCTFIGGVCGFGSSSWQYASSAACVSALNNITTDTLGSATDFAANTVACRFYHAGVAGQFVSGSAKANATLFQTHCGHVLAPSTPGGCGVSTTAAPTAASTAPTTMAKTSGASAFSLAVSAVVVLASLLSL